MKVVVAQSLGRQLVDGGHVDGPAKRAGLPKTHVVQQHNNNIGGALRRSDFETPWRLNIAGIELFDSPAVLVQE